MKHLVVALAVTALFNTAQALADNVSAFPGEAPEFIGLASQSTYADRSGDKMAVVAAFPGEAPEFIGLASQSTYADRSGDKVAAGNVFPGSLRDPIVLQAQSTYADNYAPEHNLLARGASDPAVAE